MGNTEKISVLILSLKKVHCKIIGYTNTKDSDQTAHLRISDVNISIKDSGGGGWGMVVGYGVCVINSSYNFQLIVLQPLTVYLMET